MAFVKRHRAGTEMPEAVHPDPDPRAVALGKRLAEHAAVQAVILGGSRHTGGWDEQSDLDLVAVLAEPCDAEAAEKTVSLALADLRERYYPGYRNWNSKDNGVAEGQWIVPMDFFLAHRRTVNHAMALAARQGRIIASEPGSEEKYRHDGDTSNEWGLVTLPKLRNAWSCYIQVPIIRRIFDEVPPHRLNVRTEQGRTAHRLLWHSGSAILSILEVMCPNGSLAAMAEILREKDPGWTREFASDLDCLDQYSGCGCEVVVARPIVDLEVMWGALERDREALWRRIEELSGYDLMELPERDGRNPT
ncbi:MAG: nucleotidyltransferase domain-containing protein [Chloroflexota bacterium]|nr:nucleotidyltransferase domain-containing protein [Chloroflexota bacterium]